MVTTAALDGATLASGFTTAQTFGAGSNPYNVVVADFNNDGIPDLAMPDESGTNVSVLLGNGDGTFGPALNNPVGNAPYSVAVGDFNNDGIPDLVVANYGDDTITVLLGVGDGTFTALTPVGAGSYPSAVAVGDFNNDGNLDVAVADYSGGPGSMSILLGNGNGTFQAAVGYAAGIGPYGIAVADFNGDGFLDVVVANAFSYNVSVLTGNGDGTFNSQVTYPVNLASNNAWGVAVGDFDGDGFPDIAVASSGNVSVLMNKMDGTFNPAAGYSAGNTAYAIAVGDFNLDGKLDLAVANVNGGNVSVLLGDGTGAFGSPQNLNPGGFPQGVGVGDFNGDGRPDIAGTEPPSSAAVFLGLQTETATATGVSVLGSGTQDVFADYAGEHQLRLQLLQHHLVDRHPGFHGCVCRLHAQPHDLWADAQRGRHADSLQRRGHHPRRLYRGPGRIDDADPILAGRKPVPDYRRELLHPERGPSFPSGQLCGNRELPRQQRFHQLAGQPGVAGPSTSRHPLHR